jgi:SAM-dependent methyltransferase
MNLHLGCGDDHREGYRNIDCRDTPAADEVVDLDTTPWPWSDDTAEQIVAEHVFEHLDSVEAALRECARVLRPGGLLRVTWPVGMNERADPDHGHRWVWDSPEMYCGKRPWDADVGLTVVDREVSIGSHLDGVAGVAYKALLVGLERAQGPGRWMFDMPATSGEFTVVFEA